MRFLPFVLAFVVSCAGSWPAWTDRPVPVYLSPGIPAECAESVDEALAFWAAHGVDYLTLGSSEGTIDYGILVIHRDLPDAVIGRATRIPGVGVGFITLEVCGGPEGLQVAAHEFGHLLGLDHEDDRGNLMAPNIAPGGLNLHLTEEQLESVR